MTIKRSENNPVVTPRMVKPSSPGYEVIGAFNPGAAIYNGEIILLLRVAERCVQKEGVVSVPVVKVDNGAARPDVLEIAKDDPELELKDTRGVAYKGTDYLSSLSHIRLARSLDGINFKVDEKPFIFPSREEEMFGVEDARVVCLDGYYYINYTAVSRDSWATALARTRDFRTVEKLGLIFCPENKDVAIFPEKVNGKYCCLHRPNNNGFGKPSIWYAESEDLISWGGHRCIARPRDNKWEALKIGGGAPSIRTPEGWLQIYHGKGEGIYSLFAMLLDLNEPYKVLRRSERPIMAPEADYEKQGFFNNCIFSNGMVQKEDGTLLIYYGACDGVTCAGSSSIDRILEQI